MWIARLLKSYNNNDDFWVVDELYHVSKYGSSGHVRIDNMDGRKTVITKSEAMSIFTKPVWIEP